MIEHLAKYQKIYLSALLLAALLSPAMIRHLDGNDLLINPSSYYHLNAAREGSHHAYHLFLSLNPSGSHLIYQAMCLGLGLFSMFLLCFIAKSMGIRPRQRLFCLLFLLISPAFIYTFTTLNHHALFIFLSLLGFSLLLYPNRKINYLSFPIFAALAFFDLFSALFTMLLLNTYFYFKNRTAAAGSFFSLAYLKKDVLAKILLTVLLFFTLFNIGEQFFFGPFHSQSLVADLFSETGGSFGISFFLLLLAFFGISTVWKKEKLFLAYLSIPLILAYFVYTPSMIYLTFLLAFLAAEGFEYLYQKEWKLEPIKNLTLFLLLLGITFSALVSIGSLAGLPPGPAMKESLEFLEDYSFPEETVFSLAEEGHLVEYFSRRPAFVRHGSPDFKQKEDISRQILSSTYIQYTFPLLEQNNISFVYLSPKARAELPADRGLIFLFQNERFKRIYSQDNIEIWEFKQEG